MPGQLKSLKSDECATQDVPEESKSSNEGPPAKRETFTRGDSIAEEAEEEDVAKSSDKVEEKPAEEEVHPGYTWRIDLAATEPHWTGWFKGLSEKFLSLSGAKLLLLAGVDRLDRDLTIGQMQGKFQMEVLPQAGHAVHEDAPDKVAEVLASFLVRNKFAQPNEDFNRPFRAC